MKDGQASATGIHYSYSSGTPRRLHGWGVIAEKGVHRIKEKCTPFFVITF